MLICLRSASMEGIRRLPVHAAVVMQKLTMKTLWLNPVDCWLQLRNFAKDTTLGKHTLKCVYNHSSG